MPLFLSLILLIKKQQKHFRLLCRSLLNPFYKRVVLNIFRDEDEIAPGEALSDKIENALDNSEYFILLASPASASNASWVPREVEYWLEKHSFNRKDKEENPPNLIIVLTDGEMQWENERVDWNKTTALPEVLKGQFYKEPFYVDLRNIKKDYLLFNLKDIIDWAGFFGKLKGQESSLGKYVYELFNEENRKFINAWRKGKTIKNKAKFSI